MEKPCAKCGLLFGSHAPDCPERVNPFAEVERAMAESSGATTARERQVRKARTVLRLVEQSLAGKAEQTHRLGSDPELQNLPPQERWQAVASGLDEKAESLAQDIQNAQEESVRKRLMTRFKGLMSFKAKVHEALKHGMTDEAEAALLRDQDSVYAMSAGDMDAELERDVVRGEIEELEQGSAKLADVLAGYDAAQARVQEAQESLAIKPEEQEEIDRGLDARLKKAYKFIARERLAEAEVKKIEAWLDGDPEADEKSLDKLPLSEALRRLSLFRDELRRVEHLPEVTSAEKESKQMERMRLAIWRDGLLKRVAAPPLDLRLWDVAEHAEKLEQEDILHFDKAERRRHEILLFAKKIANSDLSEKSLKNLADAKGRFSFTEEEAKIILTAALTHEFRIAGVYLERLTKEKIDKDGFQYFEPVDLRRAGKTTRKLLARAMMFEGIFSEDSSLIWQALMKHGNQDWARGILDILAMKTCGLGEPQDAIALDRMSRLDNDLLGLAFAKISNKRIKRSERLAFDLEYSWFKTNLPKEDLQMLTAFMKNSKT